MTWYPGCGGCCESKQLTPCLKFADAFDDGSIDPTWTQQAGSWNESGGYLYTTSQDARIVSSIGDTAAKIIYVDVYAQELEDKARIWLRRNDANNYLAVELEFGESGFQAGKISLLATTGGTPITTQFCWSNELVRETWLRVVACHEPSSNRFSVALFDINDNLLSYVWMVDVILGAGDCGLGTGDQVTGQIRFDNYRESYSRQTPDWSHCPACPDHNFCSFDAAFPSWDGQGYFLEGLAPDRWRMDISGVDVGIGYCTTGECTQINAAYVLENPCLGTVEVPNQICTDSGNYISSYGPTLSWEPSGAYGVKAIVELNEYGYYFGNYATRLARFERIWADGVKSVDINNISMSRVDQKTEFHCSGNNAECNLTAMFD